MGIFVRYASHCGCRDDDFGFSDTELIALGGEAFGLKVKLTAVGWVERMVVLPSWH